MRTGHTPIAASHHRHSAGISTYIQQANELDKFLAGCRIFRENGRRSCFDLATPRLCTLDLRGAGDTVSNSSPLVK